jgi:nicotinamidase-related amidase
MNVLKKTYKDEDKMRKLFYMGLEAYNARYTLQLTEWNRRVFERRGIDVVYVPGETLDDSKKIVVGQVLDAHGRSYFAMSQMMNLVRMMQRGEVTSEDVIYFEDMFQPGFESLPYIIDQLPETMWPRIYVRCLAQSIDPDDFVHVWGMDRWMRQYENMVCSSISGVLASNEEMVANIKVAGWDVPIYNISGLAFGKDEVIERVDNYLRPFSSRRMRVVFSARWDQEKQPDFYMDLIEAWRERYPSKNVEFVICSGGELKSNNDSYMARTRKMVEDGKLIIYDNLDKNKYYEIVNDSRVVFNCALQDWTSNTVSEADALGCNVLYPAYRSFPEIFANDHERMYVPWSIDDAITKLDSLLKKPHENMGKISDWTDGTIDRICDILEGKGEKWRRDNFDYRNHTREAKY